MRKKQRGDFDSPWKQAIYLHLEDFLELCFPDIYCQVDWSLGYEVLDKELPRLTRDAGQNSSHADTLIRLVRKNGLEAWVVLHIEVQSQVDPNFAQRMYIYNYRVFDKHPGDVASLAVLGDTQPDWKPNNYQRQLWGCMSQLTFPIVKLCEMEARAIQHLTNPVAWLIRAHLRAPRSPVHSESRLHSKVQLVRGLYGCGLSKQQILDFFHLVDWVLALSPDLEYDFQVQLALIEEETNMPYITSIERLALQRGREEGREAGREEGLFLALDRILQIRFSVNASPFLERLRQRGDAAEIERVIELAATAKDYASLERQVGKFA